MPMPNPKHRNGEVWTLSNRRQSSWPNRSWNENFLVPSNSSLSKRWPIRSGVESPIALIHICGNKNHSIKKMHHTGCTIQSRTDVPFSCLRNNRLAWLSAMCGETKPKLRLNKTTASENQFSPRRQPRHQQHVHAPRSLLASTNSTEHHRTNKQGRLSPYYSSQPPTRKTVSGSNTQKFLQAKTNARKMKMRSEASGPTNRDYLSL